MALSRLKKIAVTLPHLYNCHIFDSCLCICYIFTIFCIFFASLLRWPPCCPFFYFLSWASWALEMWARFGHQRIIFVSYHLHSDQIRYFLLVCCWTHWIQQGIICLHCGILWCWTNSSKCTFKNLLFIGSQTMLTEKTIRFHISAEMRYNQEPRTKSYIWRASVVFISWIDSWFLISWNKGNCRSCLWSVHTDLFKGLQEVISSLGNCTHTVAFTGLSFWAKKTFPVDTIAMA